MQISIVIATYNRESVLIETIEHLLSLKVKAAEVLIVDQTAAHTAATETRLQELHDGHLIRWVRLSKPSITAAMNHGLRIAKSELVLFVDDDIEPISDLVAEHAKAFAADNSIWATVGQIIQPWQTSDARPAKVGRLTGLNKDMDFRFNSTMDDDVENTMAGNLCVHRQRILSIGGFDENFIGSAIQFETDFARRIVNTGGRIRFLGSAGLNHLAAGKGGTRAYGSHLKCGNALHSVGGYYYAFRNSAPAAAWWYSIKRFFRQVRTKFHLTHPWWIPVKLTGEVRAILMARKLVRQGPKLIPPEESDAKSNIEGAAPS